MSEKADQVVTIIDVETTGTSPERDQIVEFAVQKGFGDNAFNKSWRFKPAIPIPPAATAVHGIRDEDVADSPPFSSATGLIRKIIDGSDVIVGYNLKFDLEMLQAEFKRAKVNPLSLRGKHLIDPLALWRRCEPRGLANAVERFVKKPHTGAHSALGDVRATAEVLKGMLNEWGLNAQSWEELAVYIDPERKNWIGESFHLQWENGVPVFGFGKHRGKPVSDAVKDDTGYSEWINSRPDFPAHVRELVSAAARMDAAEFRAFVVSEFGEA
jgi:DNA polymerase-3 subunit epsilon